MVKSPNVTEVQARLGKSSLRKYICKYKSNAIQRVKTFKRTGVLLESCKEETSFITKTNHLNNTLCEESIVNDYVQVDCVQHQVLRGYSNIKQLLKTKIDMEIKSLPNEYYCTKVMKAVDFILNHITVE